MLDGAVTLQNRMPKPIGRPMPVKDVNELYGELLLQVGRAREAIAWFDRALARTPNRSRAVLGLARAYRNAGDTVNARAAYKRLLTNYRLADAGLPEIAEARDSSLPVRLATLSTLVAVDLDRALATLGRILGYAVSPIDLRVHAATLLGQIGSPDARSGLLEALPTAPGRAFSDLATAEKYLATQPLPVMIKADHPAGGEAVYHDRYTALEGLRDLITARPIEGANDGVVIESYLEGPRIALSAFTDGHTAVPLLPTRLYDHVEEGDGGPLAPGIGAHTSGSRQWVLELHDAPSPPRSVHRPVAELQKSSSLHEVVPEAVVQLWPAAMRSLQTPPAQM